MTMKRKQCPKCGGVSGFTTHDYFSGWAEFIGKWDLSDGDYPQFSDTVKTRRISKTAVCLDCQQQVSRPI